MGIKNLIHSIGKDVFEFITRKFSNLKRFKIHKLLCEINQFHRSKISNPRFSFFEGLVIDIENGIQIRSFSLKNINIVTRTTKEISNSIPPKILSIKTFGIFTILGQKCRICFANQLTKFTFIF